MNRDDILQFLSALLSGFWVHKSLIDDLLPILSNSGSETKFFNLLLARLKWLLERGVQATTHKEFEPISNGIYSMHMAGNGFNIRILYAFAPDQSPVILTAFFERGGKRKTSYEPYIPVAQRRMKEEMEAHGYV